MDKYIYYGGRRTLGEYAGVSLEKNHGNDQFLVKIDCSSTASGMDALEAIVRAYEQWLGVPAHHILAVLATVMTVPCGHIENVGAMADQRKYSTPEEAAEAWNKMEKEKPEILNSDRLRNLTDEELSEALYELQHRDDLQDPSDYLNWLLGTDWR